MNDETLLSYYTQGSISQTDSVDFEFHTRLESEYTMTLVCEGANGQKMTT